MKTIELLLGGQNASGDAAKAAETEGRVAELESQLAEAHHRAVMLW